MATCASCGAAILWKRLDGQPFAVDAHETTHGKESYAQHGNLLLRVKPGSDVAAYAAHHCPGDRR